MKRIIRCFLCIIMLLAALPVTASAKNTKCQLYIDVTFKENLIFDKYNVTILVDGREIDTIQYAKPYSHLVGVEKGEHTVTFCKEDDSDVKGEETLDVTGDMTYRCQIQTDGKKINIVSSEQEMTLEGSSIEMPDVQLAFVSKAAGILEAEGFLNVSYEDLSGNSVKKDQDWIVMEQSEKPGTLLDKNDEILLICEKTTDFLSSHFEGKNVRSAIKEARTIGYEISFVDSVLDRDMRNDLASCSEEELKKWKVSEIVPIDSECKIAQLKISFSGKRKVPGVIGMSVPHAIFELKQAGFDKFELQSDEGKAVKESDGAKWKVVAQSAEAGTPATVEEQVLLTCIEYKKATKEVYFELSEADRNNSTEAEPETESGIETFSEESSVETEPAESENSQPETETHLAEASAEDDNAAAKTSTRTRTKEDKTKAGEASKDEESQTKEKEPPLEEPSFVEIHRGDKGDSVIKVQSTLAALGYLSSSPDGSFGPKTEQAVKDFQKEAGIETTGIIDQATYDVLNSNKAPKKKEAPSQVIELKPEITSTPSEEVTRNTYEQMVWIPTHGGKKFHSKSSCSGMIDPQQVTRSEAESMGFEPCGRCHP